MSTQLLATATCGQKFTLCGSPWALHLLREHTLATASMVISYRHAARGAVRQGGCWRCPWVTSLTDGMLPGRGHLFCSHGVRGDTD